MDKDYVFVFQHPEKKVVTQLPVSKNIKKVKRWKIYLKTTAYIIQKGWLALK